MTLIIRHVQLDLSTKTGLLSPSVPLCVQCISLVPGVCSSHCRSKDTHNRLLWLIRLSKASPTPPSKSSGHQLRLLLLLAFIFSETKTQQKTIPAWRTVTPSCQMLTSHWRQRCLKPELASLLLVAMTTTAFSKYPPTSQGNSQVSPGNQNGSFYLHGNMKRVDSRAPVLGPVPVPVLRGFSLTRGMWSRVCCIADRCRCRSRSSRLFLEWRSIGPSSLNVGS